MKIKIETFEKKRSIVGHSDTINYLLSFLNHKFSCSFIFYGPKGVGKLTVALSLAEALLKGLGVERNLSIEKWSHPNIMVIGESSQSNENNITLKEIEYIMQWINTIGQRNDSSFVIIDSIKDANKKSVCTLMKTLEEPRHGIFIILIAHNTYSNFSTISSRCQKFWFKPLNSCEMTTVLPEILPEVPQDHLMIYQNFAEGCPGRALVLYNLGGIDFYKKTLGLLKDLSRGNMSKLFNLLNYSNFFWQTSSNLSPKEEENLVHFISWWITRFLRMNLLNLRNNDSWINLFPEEEEIVVTLLKRKPPEFWSSVSLKIITLWHETETLGLNRRSAILEIFKNFIS